MIKFTTFVRKGNARGTGFIRIPLELRKKVKLEDNTKIEFSYKDSNISFYGKTKNYSGLGVYVPQNINKRYNIIGEKFEISLKIIDGFYTKSAYDGRIYIPKKISEALNLKPDTIIKLSAKIDNKEICKFCKVNVRKRSHTTEYFCMLGSNFLNKEAIFKIEKILKKSYKKSSYLFSVVNDLNFGVMDKNRAVIFDGLKIPIIVDTNIKIHDFAHYLGAFFADGTKRGNSWGIVASTFEQAKYYISQHRKLIKDAKIKTYISITSNKNVDEKFLMSKWKKEAKISTENIRTYETKTKHSKNRNLFGSLVIKEHRKLVQNYYNRMLKYLYNVIKKNDDKNIATDFILGVMEGDGSVSGSKEYGHIIITTNKKDSIFLQKILTYTDFNFKAYEELKTKKQYIRINSLSILRNISILKHKLFKYYPKRRKKFIERFQNVGAVRFIIGKQDYASSWVKTYLKKNGILNDNYELTPQGKKIKLCLNDMINELK